MNPPSLIPDNRSPLALANTGYLNLTFVGTGSAFSKKFFQNNLLIVKGTSHILVDCGTRTPEALSLLGLSVTQIQNYLITHSHADHIGGLEEVMLVNRYGPRKKPNIIITESYERLLWENSLKGGSAFNESHRGHPLVFEDFWNIARPIPIRGADREMAKISLGDMELILFRTKHIPDSAKTWHDSCISYGLIIDRHVLFTSDTRYDPQMVLDFDSEFHFTSIFHDCQLFTGGVHASIDELASLPKEIKQKTYLMHYQDFADTQVARAKELGFAGFVEQWRSYPFHGAVIQ